MKQASTCYYIILSCSISLFLTACTNNPPAPIESASSILEPSKKAQPPAHDAPTKNANILTTKSTFNGYICEGAAVFKGKSIGDGECVDFIKLCSNAPLTKFWKPGSLVFGKNIPEGAAIATFRKGKYPNRSGYHAAIYSHQDANGIYAWDQWQGQTVHLRYIKAHQSHKNPGNNASRYRVIKQ